MKTLQLGPYLILSFTLLTGAGCVFVYKGNPFEDGGPFQVNTRTLERSNDNIPAHTEVIYPTPPGTYVPVIFLPGLFTMVYTESYSTMLANLASFGYVVAGIDLLWPTLAAREGHSEKVQLPGPGTVFEVIQWLKKNLDSKIESGVKADWDKLGVMCHSVSAEWVVDMLYENSTFAKAAAFLEPGDNHFTKPFGYYIPALSYGTGLCMDSPECCFEGWSYEHFYSELTCPKITMNVTGYGHCDTLDETFWDICDVFHVCKVDPGNNRDLYRQVFLPGVLASFFGTYLQGNTALVDFITHADLMPIPLTQLYFDLNCTAT